MATKHTPGPWSLAEGFPSIVVGRGYRICDTNGSFNPPPEEQDLGNARLIAAAPDLLSSLKEIVSKAYLRPGKHEDYHVHPALIDQARTIISMAEGRS